MRPALLVLLIGLLVSSQGGFASEDDCVPPVIGSLTHDGIAAAWGWTERTYTFTAELSGSAEDPVLIEWSVDGLSVAGEGKTLDARFADPGGHTVAITVTDLSSDCAPSPTSQATVGFVAYDPEINFVEWEEPPSNAGCLSGLITFPGPAQLLPPPYIHSCFWDVFIVERTPGDGLVGEVRVDGQAHHAVTGDRIREEVTTDGLSPGAHRFQPCFFYPKDKHGLEWCDSAREFLTV